MGRGDRGQGWLRTAGVSFLLAAFAAPAAVGSESAAVDSECAACDDELEASTLGVNEGKLSFLAEPPAKAVHHHHNDIVIGPESLREGWVRLEQCHEHLDAVPRAEVVYPPGRIRGVSVASSRGIDRAWVEGPSLQLEGVQRGAELCVKAESRAFSAEQDGAYTLHNGPYMRRFLDGYYPMRVTMTVRYPCDRLRFAGSKPEPQPGFTVRDRDCRVDVEAWFEGRLQTELRFLPTTASP